jgi:hypothetical protein
VLKLISKIIGRNSIKWMLAAAAAVAVASIGGVVATASPAQAAAWYCPSSIACFYSDFNGGGAILTVGPAQGCLNAPAGWNDVASSVRNNVGNGYLLRFWINANCSSSSWSAAPGNQGNLGGGGGTSYPFPDNGMSSYAVYPPGTW